MDISGDVSISGGGLPETYKAAQFHLHWGSTNMRGSEHKRDSAEYPMEVSVFIQRLIWFFCSPFEEFYYNKMF